jgi:phosphocarrier protein HPr
MSDPETPQSRLVETLDIINMRGLHARASAKFVKTVEEFDAVVTVEKDGSTVGGTSIMGLMMLAAGKGSSIIVSAEGPEAAKVMQALTLLLANRFDEGE